MASKSSDLEVKKVILGEKRVPKKLNSDYITVNNEKIHINKATGKKYGGGIVAGVFDYTSPDNFMSSYGTEIPKINERQTRKWLLIVCTEDFFLPDPTMPGKDEYGLVSKLNYRNKSENFISYNTSVTDGHKNTYGDGMSVSVPKYRIFKKFKDYKKNGHRDWYIPSFYELLFIADKKYDLDIESTIQRNLIREYGRSKASDIRFKSMKGNYISSSLAHINNFREMNGSSYNYGVQFNRSAAGSYYVKLCDHYEFNKIRPIRRIYLP